MKVFVQLLRLPWFARVPSWRGWATALVWLVIAVDAGKAINGLSGAQQFGLAVLTFAVMMVWTLVPNVLWLARETRCLRIPGAGQEADWCLLLYILLSIALPALALGAVFGHPLTWLVSLALVASAIFALRTLPIWIVWGGVLALIVIVPFFFNAMHVPQPGDPRFLAWAAPTAIVLGVACVQRWHTLRSADLSALNRWWTPSGQGLRNARMKVLRGGSHADSIYKRYADAAESRSIHSLRRIGSDHPVRSIQLVINPLAGPSARRGLRRFLMCVVLVVTVFVILLVKHVFPPAARMAIAHQLPMFGILFLSGWIDLFVPKVATRWSSRHGELPLLALLPNLGTPAVCKRATLLASLRIPAAWSAAVIIALVPIAAVLHAPLPIYPLLLVVAISGLALDAATVTHVLAGRPAHGIMQFAPKIAVFVLLIASVGLWALALPDNASKLMSPIGEILMCAVFGLWLAWLALTLVLAWRGWRLLQHRPHPFLANLPR